MASSSPWDPGLASPVSSITRFIKGNRMTRFYALWVHHKGACWTIWLGCPKDKIVRTTTGLEVDNRGLVEVDENGATTREGVFSGVDVVLDVLGGKALADNVRALAQGGRLVVIGLQQGRRGELDLNAVLAKRAVVTGTTLRSRSPEEKAALLEAVREHVWPMVADRRVRPVVHAVFPLEDVEEAAAVLERGEAFGKVLLVP